MHMLTCVQFLNLIFVRSFRAIWFRASHENKIPVFYSLKIVYAKRPNFGWVGGFDPIENQIVGNSKECNGLVSSQFLFEIVGWLGGSSIRRFTIPRIY